MEFKIIVKERVKIILFAVICFCSFGIANSETAYQHTGMSFDIQKAIDELKTGIYSSPEDEKRRKLIIKKIHSWIMWEFSVSSHKKAIKPFQKRSSSISGKENITWNERMHFRFENRNKILIINELSWKNEKVDLLTIQIDYISYYYRKEGYPTSAPPQLYLRSDKSNIVKADLSDWIDSGLLPAIYTIHGFIHYSEEVCPDVLISTGPAGSGNFVYFYQMHYDKLSQRWKNVWKFGAGHIVNVEYPENNGNLAVTFLVDKWKGEKDTIFFQLKWGEQPDYKNGSRLK